MSVQYHEDDRGQRLLDIFPEVDGQINITHVNSTSHIVAWHKHIYNQIIGLVSKVHSK